MRNDREIDNLLSIIQKKITMDETKVISIPEGSGNSVPAWLPFMNNNGGIFGGNGLGGGILGFLIGMLFPRLFGNGGFFGNGMGGGVVGTPSGAGTAYLGNMISNDNGRELIMQAITSQGDQSRQAIQTLSTMLGQDFNLVNISIQAIQGVLSNIALQQAVSVPQIINAIQNGDNNLAAQFQNCCCENRLAICQQTNALQNSINGVGQQVASKAAADRLAMCEQTYNLTDTMNRNYLALDNKIDAMESSRKDREITALTAEVATLKSQNFTAGVVQQAVAPINAALAGLHKEVDDIKCKMPNTINVEYPQVAVVNTTPYMGGFYGGGFYGGFNGGF